MCRPQTKDKYDDIKERFYKELDTTGTDQFPIYHMTILLGDFNAKLGREDF
jgi:hypothetical protein